MYVVIAAVALALGMQGGASDVLSAIRDAFQARRATRGTLVAISRGTKAPDLRVLMGYDFGTEAWSKVLEGRVFGPDAKGQYYSGREYPGGVTYGEARERRIPLEMKIPDLIVRDQILAHGDPLRTVVEAQRDGDGGFLVTLRVYGSRDAHGSPVGQSML